MSAMSLHYNLKHTTITTQTLWDYENAWMSQHDNSKDSRILNQLKRVDTCFIQI